MSSAPIGGEGLNLGIGDAVNLGWKLAATAQSMGSRKRFSIPTRTRSVTLSAPGPWNGPPRRLP